MHVPSMIQSNCSMNAFQINYIELKKKCLEQQQLMDKKHGNESFSESIIYAFAFLIDENSVNWKFILNYLISSLENTLYFIKRILCYLWLCFLHHEFVTFASSPENVKFLIQHALFTI